MSIEAFESMTEDHQLEAIAYARLRGIEYEIEHKNNQPPQGIPKPGANRGRW